MDRATKAVTLAVLSVLVIVGVIGTVVWHNTVGFSSSQSESTPTANELLEQERLPGDSAVNRANEVQAEKEKQDRDATAKAEAERLAKEKEDAERKRKAEPAAEPQKKEQDAESKRFAAAIRAKETVTREKRRKSLLENRAVPTTRFNAIMCAEKSAAEFEQEFFADSPEFQADVRFFDVSTADGTLIVHLAIDPIELSKEAQKVATDAVVRAWRKSKFTKSYGFSKSVEFRRGDAVLFTDEG